MQHVRPPQSKARRSAPASRELVFAWEPYVDIAKEVFPLWRQHYREIALDQDICPLAPDTEWYLTVDSRSILHVLTARSNGHLVGYIFNIVGPHNHYSETLFAHTEMFWLHPDFRKGWQPVKMFVENLRGLKARGAALATINFKLSYKNGRVGQLLHRLGYEATDITLRKRL